MSTFVGDSPRRAKDFCFKMFLTRPLETGRNTQQGLVKMANGKVEASYSNLRSYHDLNLGGLGYHLPDPSPEAAG
jgi:hypothetical protein